MDKKITDFITTELKIGNIHAAPIDLLLWVFASVFALMARISVASYTAASLPSYVELVAGLKVVTGVFDVLLSLLVGFYVYRLTRHKVKAYLAYAVTLLLPVLCAGSAMWGMGDSVYVFFAVLSLLLLQEEKGSASLVSYGVSLFLSRYAFFLLPVYAIAFLQKKNKLIFFLFPLCGAGLRSFIVSRGGKQVFPLFEADRLFRSTRGDTLLSYNWPNIYQLIGTDKFVIEYGAVARWLVMALMLAIVAAAFTAGRELSRDNLTAFAALLCMLVPFFMPQMDERCGLLADILLLIAAMQHTGLYYVAILHNILSYMAYSAYFRGESVVPFSYVALVNLFLIAVMLIFVGDGRTLNITFKREGEKHATG